MFCSEVCMSCGQKYCLLFDLHQTFDIGPKLRKLFIASLHKRKDYVLNFFLKPSCRYSCNPMLHIKSWCNLENAKQFITL